METIDLRLDLDLSRMPGWHIAQSHTMVEAWLSERLRRWSNKPDVVGSSPVTTELFLISWASNQVPKWFGTHYHLEVPSHI